MTDAELRDRARRAARLILADRARRGIPAGGLFDYYADAAPEPPRQPRPPEPRARGMAAAAAEAGLLADHRRTNAAIARGSGSNPSTVAEVRNMLESVGALPRWRGKHPGPASDKRERATKLLRELPWLPDPAVAQLAGCSAGTVKNARRGLSARPG